MSDKFLVITSNGHWGIGDSFTEAAKNAKVSAKPVAGSVTKAPSYLVGNLHCTEFGGVAWTWTDKAMEFSKEAREALNKAMTTVGAVKIIKGRACIIEKEGS